MLKKGFFEVWRYPDPSIERSLIISTRSSNCQLPTVIPCPPTPPPIIKSQKNLFYEMPAAQKKAVNVLKPKSAKNLTAMVVAGMKMKKDPWSMTKNDCVALGIPFEVLAAAAGAKKKFSNW